jgi:hypothetical protein
MSAAPPGVAWAPRVDLATRDDEPELRRLLRENPMEGAVRVSLEREPDAFVGASIEGRPHHTVVARDPSTGRVVGMGSRAVMDVFVNGVPARVGYLSQLRVERAYRGRRRLLARGYEVLADRHGPGEEPFDLTSIVADNAPALRLFGAGVPGLPTYRPLERFVTLVISTWRPQPWRRGLPAEVGTRDHLDEIAACLERSARRHQLARRWPTADLVSPQRCPGLHPEDFRLAFEGRMVVGTAALWDQTAFKQVMVRGYAPGLARWRSWINRGARLVGAPRFPDPGTALPHAYLSHVAVDGDDPKVFARLLRAALDEARRRRYAYVVAGFAERHPLLAVARGLCRAREYGSLLHVVHGEGGAAAASRLDGRVPHVEVALL